jgi:hypothetical protein
VLDAFLSTWSNARSTFGEGTPQTGAQYDSSGPLREMQTNVQSAAPGSKWTGAAANAYGTANADHGEVFGKLANLDERLSAQVDRSSQVVDVGRRNREAVRQWVIDAAASVPPGKNRDQMLMPIVQKGLSQLSEIVTKSNADLNKIGGEIRGLGGEYDALGNQKFAPKKGDGVLAGWGNEDDEKEKEDAEKKKHDVEKGAEDGQKDGESLADGQLSPEESQRLRDATNLTPEQKAALDNGNLALPPEQMAYLNGLSRSLDGKSPAEIKATLDKLPPSEAQAVSNALHLVGTEGVRTDVVDPSLKPGEPGYVPATGGKENLPQSIQDIFDAPLKNSPVPEQVIGPDGRPTIEWPDPNKPYKYLDEYRDVAAISNYGDPSLQRGSAINDGLLAESRELLNDYDSETRPNPGLGNDWGHQNLDPTLQEMLSAASHDAVAVHDAVVEPDGTPNDDFIGDVFKHDWADDGLAAGSLFPDAADTSERAGQTMHAFDDYAGRNYQELLNIEGKQSLGQINPALTQALGQANTPYIDDMFNANKDSTQGFGSLDGLDAEGGNPNMPVTRGLFAVIGSDPTANAQFNTAATDVWKGYISDYSTSLVDHGIPDTGSLQAAGYLQRMMDQGEFLHQYDLSGDAEVAARKAIEQRGVWYDLAHDAGSFIPGADRAISIYDKLPGDPLRDLFVGKPPDESEPMFRPKNINEVTHLVASYAVAQGAGDLGILGDQVTSTWLAEHVLEPFDGSAEVQGPIDEYLSGLAGKNDMGWTKYTSAYETGLTVPQDELDNLKQKGT